MQDNPPNSHPIGIGTAPATSPIARRWQSNLLFIRSFFLHPRMLGSIIPSSRFLIHRLLAPIDWSRAKVIVEFGPGVGVITREIIKRMRPDTRLIAIELNLDFVNYLRGTLSDARVVVIHGSAGGVERALRQSGALRADYVISGIPFSTMPAAEREATLDQTCAVLDPDGLFLVYQFSSRVLADLRRVFHHVKRRFEPLNILPAHLYFCAPGPGLESGGPTGR